MQREIQEILDLHIRPVLQADGGDMIILDFKEKEKYLKLRLMGQCCTCPQSSYTIENVVKATLKSRFKNIDTIEVDKGVSEEMLNLAREFLRR